MVDLGNQLYHGQGGGGTCVGCHGADASGTAVGPNLTDDKWLWGDGSVAAIAKAITEGVSQPKEFRAPMPALGGAQLSADQVNAIAAYLWGLSHRSGAAAPVAKAAATLGISGEKIFPESMTSTRDGTIIIGSLGARTIYRAAPGATTAEAWIPPAAADSPGIFGVFADDKSKTLWACFGAAPAPGPNASLHAFDLRSGKAKGQYEFPTAAALCNDIAVDSDGTVYATDSRNMQVVRLTKHAKQLEVWADADHFGPKNGVIDGIAVLGKMIYANTLAGGKLYGVPIEHDGKAGAATEIKLERALERPDGMRSFGKDLLIIESGGVGRLTRAVVSGDSAQLSTVAEGFPGGPVAVAYANKLAYVLEGQLTGRTKPDAVLQPFHATAVEIAAP
jgi:Cytochrome C oxidase, cbb3-type, subunit III